MLRVLSSSSNQIAGLGRRFEEDNSGERECEGNILHGTDGERGSIGDEGVEGQAGGIEGNREMF